MKLRWAILIVAVMAFAIPALAGSASSPTAAGKMVYTSTKDGQADIYSMDAFGKTVFNLTHDKTIGARTDVQPVWSPTGQYVAFERQYAKAGADLMVVKSDGTQLHQLVPAMTPGVWNCHPAWSSHNIIYFTSNRDGNFELYSILPNGTGLKQLTRTSAPIQNLGPAVSRDGNFVVFYRAGLLPWGSTELFVLNVAKGVVTQLTWNFRGAGDSDPTWSPNGKQIAFTSDRMGRDDIWMVNSNGRNAVQVTHRPPYMSTTMMQSNDVHPAFSPDGGRIAFVSTRTGATEIFTIGVPGSAAQPLRQITFDGAYKANLSWQMPLPTLLP